MSQDPQTDNANRAAEADDKDASAAADGQPIRRLERDGVDFTLIGTAHVSRASADAVRELAASGKFDAIAVELCQARYEALTAERKWTDLDLYRILREGKAGLVMANLALSAYQRRIAEQFGIELTAHGFCKTNPVSPIETTRPGVFISGAFQGPMDIPESVMSASGANAQCATPCGAKAIYTAASADMHECCAAAVARAAAAAGRVSPPQPRRFP